MKDYCAGLNCLKKLKKEHPEFIEYLPSRIIEDFENSTLQTDFFHRWTSALKSGEWKNNFSYSLSVENKQCSALGLGIKLKGIIVFGHLDNSVVADILKIPLETVTQIEKWNVKENKGFNEIANYLIEKYL